MFMLVDTKNLPLMTLGIAVAVVILSALYAVVAGYMVSVFPPRLRYSGISISYQLICAIAGGTTPLIGTVIAKNYAGQWLPLALFQHSVGSVPTGCDRAEPAQRSNFSL